MTQGQALRVTLRDERMNNVAVDLPPTPNRVLSPAQDRFLGATSTIATDSQLQTSVEAALGFTAQVVEPVVGKTGSVCVQFSIVLGTPKNGLTIHISFAGTTTTKNDGTFEVDYMFGVGGTWELGAIGLKAWSFSFEGHITVESSNPIADAGCDNTKPDCLSPAKLEGMSAGEKSRHLLKKWIKIRFSNKKLTKAYAARGAKMVANSKVIYDDMTDIDAETEEHKECLKFVEIYGANAKAAATKSGCADLDIPANECQEFCDQVLGKTCTPAEKSSKFLVETVAKEFDPNGDGTLTKEDCVKEQAFVKESGGSDLRTMLMYLHTKFIRQVQIFVTEKKLKMTTTKQFLDEVERAWRLTYRNNDVLPFWKIGKDVQCDKISKNPNTLNVLVDVWNLQTYNEPAKKESIAKAMGLMCFYFKNGVSLPGAGKSGFFSKSNIRAMIEVEYKSLMDKFEANKAEFVNSIVALETKVMAAGTDVVKLGALPTIQLIETMRPVARMIGDPNYGDGSHFVDMLELEVMTPMIWLGAGDAAIVKSAVEAVGKQLEDANRPTIPCSMKITFSSSFHITAGGSSADNFGANDVGFCTPDSNPLQFNIGKAKVITALCTPGTSCAQDQCNDLKGEWKAAEATATYCLPSGTLYFDLFRKSNEANKAYWGLGFRVLMKNSALLASVKALVTGVATGLDEASLKALCVIGTPLKTFFRGMFLGTAAAPGLMAGLFKLTDAKLGELQKWIMELYNSIQSKISDIAAEFTKAAAPLVGSIKEVVINIGKEIVKNFPVFAIMKDMAKKAVKEVADIAIAMAKALAPIGLTPKADTYTGMDYEMGETVAEDKVTFFTNTIIGLQVDVPVTPGVGISVQGYYSSGNSAEC
jgi:hypothetical protein